MIEIRNQDEVPTRVGVRLRIPHSAFPTPNSRRAISLLEVLVSMGILTIGLLSIASLLPVGLFQAQKAVTEDAKAIIGHNAYREFRTRGMANPYTWINYNVGVLQRNPQTNRDEPNNAVFNPGVAIDPWGIAAMASATPAISGSEAFPLERSDMNNQNLEGPSLRRVTIRSVWPDHSGTNTQMNLQVNEELARSVFVSDDDTIWEKSNNPDGPAISRWETDVPSNPGVYFRREYAGNYSWMATMVPRYPPYGPAAGMRQPLSNEWRVSIAIFHRRNPRVVFRDDGLNTERQVKVKNNDQADLMAFGLGGGQLLINDPKPAEFRVGEWVLVSGWYDQTGNGQRNALGTNACFLWYRVVAFDRSNDNDPNTYPTVTLAGSDWPWRERNPQATASNNSQNNNAPKWPCNPSHITILDGCVGVFEKTIHLEGPSMYSQ